MPHPITFSDDDFGLCELREIALSFPGAFEKISSAEVQFRCVSQATGTH